MTPNPTMTELRLLIGSLAEALPPLSAEEEAATQRMMRRDRLLRTLSAAHLAKDEAAVVAAKQALTAFDEAARG